MAATYVVTAPLVIAKNAEGGDVHVYQGAPVPGGQSRDWIDRHVESKMIARAGTSSDDPSQAEVPKSNASRDEWEAYALASGKTAEDLDGLGRNQIRDLFA